jgi:hypothetical protein
LLPWDSPRLALSMEKTASATEAVPERKTLVAIQVEREFDLLDKSWDERVFVKLYVSARTSGLLRAISDRDWKTLCTLATFMDGDGRCYPSQAKLARALGISRSAANERVRGLAGFRFEGKPVLLVERRRKMTKDGMRFDANRYTILPVTKLKIFDRNGETGGSDKKSPVSPFHDTGPARHGKTRHGRRRQ